MTTRFNTLVDALNAGYVRAFNFRYNGIKAVDVSGIDSQGYDYELRDAESNTIVTSETVWFSQENNRMGKPGCFRVMFDTKKLA